MFDAVVAKNQDAVVFGEEPGTGDLQDPMRKQTETTGREESSVLVCVFLEYCNRSWQ